MRKLELEGVRSGMLVAIERTDKKYKSHLLWRCRCDCGNEKLVPSTWIRRGSIKSCGCNSTCKKNLVGIKYGHLTVIALSEIKHKSGQRLWLCRCVCGTEKKITGYALTHRFTKTCGCKGGRTSLLRGKRFGYLVPQKTVGRDKYSHLIWECACDCGRVTNVKAYQLLTGNTKSCGCKRRRDRKQHKNWRGVGEIASKHWQLIKQGAKRRKLPYEISMEYAWSLFVKQKGLCALSGREIVFAESLSLHAHGFTTASLDRIDSSKGYVEGNIQWVHKKVNIMKGKMTDEELVSFCVDIANHKGRKNDI